MSVKYFHYKQLLLAIIILMLCVPLLIAQDATSAASKERIAILEIEGSGVPEDLLDLIKKSLEEAFYNIDGFEVIEREQIALVIAEQEFQLSGMVNEDTAVEIGEMVAADYVVTVSVTRLMEILLTVKILNVESGQVKYIETLSIKRQSDIQPQANKVAIQVERVFFPSRFQPMKKVVVASGQIGLPLGDIADLVSLGFGGSAGFYLHNLGRNYLDAGIEISYLYYPGVKDGAAAWYQFIPVTATAGYRFPFADNFYFRPQIWAGAVLAAASIDPDGYVVGLEDPDYETSNAVYLQSAAGVSLGMDLRNFLIETNIRYNIVFGDSSLIMTIPVSLVVGWVL